MPSFSAK
jgi:hypothetical protein